VAGRDGGSPIWVEVYTQPGAAGVPFALVCYTQDSAFETWKWCGTLQRFTRRFTAGLHRVGYKQDWFAPHGPRWCAAR
jgi:hypothetical protein